MNLSEKIREAKSLLNEIEENEVASENWVDYEIEVLRYLENGRDEARINDKISEYNNMLMEKE